MRRCSFVSCAELPYSNIVLCSTGYSNTGGDSFLGLWLSLPQTLWRTWEREQKNRSHFSVSFPKFVSAFLLFVLLNKAPPQKKEVQFDHTLGHELNADDSHIRVTRGLMTRNIGPRFSDLLDEIGRTLESLLVGAEKGTWKHNTLLEH